jgi:hypothetical protein
MKMSDQREWSFYLASSGFLGSKICKTQMHGGKGGVFRILSKCNSSLDLTDKEHDVAFEIHKAHKRWAQENDKRKLTYPDDLQAIRDAVIKNRRNKNAD